MANKEIQAFVEYDLELYLYNLDPRTPYTTIPTMYVMDGATFQTDFQSFYFTGEGNLDMQLATSLGEPLQLAKMSKE